MTVQDESLAEAQEHEGAQKDRFAWVEKFPVLQKRLDDNWTGWADEGADGLAATLDAESDWNGWDAWTEEEKRSAVMDRLDEWYQDRFDFVVKDQSLLAKNMVAQLDAKWPGWKAFGSDGLASSLNGESGWEGWDEWTDEEKRTALRDKLDEWYVDRLDWVATDSSLVGQNLVARLNKIWPGWHKLDQNGLAKSLDEEADWEGWDSWTAEEKLGALQDKLDEWYPDRIDWVTPELAARLDAHWEGEWRTVADVNGLARSLDVDENWVGWDSWSDEDKISYLDECLTEWYGAAPAEAEHAEAEAAAPPELPALEAAVADKVASAVQEAIMDDAVDFDHGDLADEDVAQLLQEILQEAIASRSTQ